MQRYVTAHLRWTRVRQPRGANVRPSPRQNRSEWLGSTIFGGCNKVVTARHAAPEAGAVAPSLSNLFSNRGEVVITLQQAAAAPPPPVGTAAVANVTSYSNVYSEGGKLDGYRLLRTDATRLMNTYGASLGDRGGAGKGLVVIDVDVHGSSIPRSRWLYATNPAYLVLDAPSLAFLSGWLLAPPVHFERVRFTNNDCSLLAPAEGALLTNEAYNTSVERIHEQLKQALLNLLPN